MYVGSTDGAWDYGRLRLRARPDGTVATSTEIYFDRASRGREGAGEVEFVDNAFIVVYNLREIWAIPPYISVDDADFATIYKKTEIAFADPDYMPPVANACPDVFFMVEDVLDSALVDFDTTLSFKTNADAGASLTSAWDFDDGTPGTSASANPVNVSFPVGARYIYKNVTDDLGVEHRAHALVAVCDREHHDLIPIEIITHTARADGQTIRIRTMRPVLYTDYPDGTEVMIGAFAEDGLTPVNVGGQVGREHIVFSGWIYSEENSGQASSEGWIARTELTLVDSAGKLKTLPGFPQIIERESEPDNWNEMKGANIDRYIHHLLQWHSNLLDRVDFGWSGTLDSYGFTRLGSDGASLWEQVNVRAQAIAYVLACDQNGRLTMRRDPQLAPSATQATLYDLAFIERTATVQDALTPADWSGYKYSYGAFPRIHWNWGDAIISSTTDVEDTETIQTAFCVIPGFAPGQGVSEQSSGQQLVTTQKELNVREVNRYKARMNALFGYLELEIKRANTTIDPAAMTWVTNHIPAANAPPRGRTMAALTRFLPIEIRWNYPKINVRGVSIPSGVRYPTILFEKEVTSGTIGQTYTPPDTSLLPPIEVPPVDPPVIPPNGGTGLRPGAGTLYVYTETGKLYKTTDFNTLESSGGATFVLWDDILAGGLGGTTLRDATYNAFSSGAKDAWVVSNSQVAQYSNYTDASPTVGTPHTLPFDTPATIMQFERGELWGIVAQFKNLPSNGLGIAYTTNGTSWTNKNSGDVAAFGNYDANYVNNGDIFIPGVHLNPHTAGDAIISVMSTTASPPAKEGYRTSDHGATWAAISNPDLDGQYLASSIIVPFQLSPANAIFFGGLEIGAVFITTTLKRAIGTSVVNISPVDATLVYGVPFGSFNNRCMSAADDDPNSLIICAMSVHGTTGVTKFAVFLTRNALAATPTWIRLSTPATTTPEWTGVYFVNRNTAYFTGTNGKVGVYTTAQGNRIDNRSGNLPTLSGNARVVALMGE